MKEREKERKTGQRQHILCGAEERREEGEKSSAMGALRCDERERLIKGMILEAGWRWIVLFSLKEDISLNSV